MFLLVTRDTQLDARNWPHILRRGLVLHVARDSPQEAVAVQLVLSIDSEPPAFSVADGIDLVLPRRAYPTILEYATWDALRAAAWMCRWRRERRSWDVNRALASARI